MATVETVDRMLVAEWQKVVITISAAGETIPLLVDQTLPHHRVVLLHVLPGDLTIIREHPDHPGLIMVVQGDEAVRLVDNPAASLIAAGVAHLVEQVVPQVVAVPEEEINQPNQILS